MQIVLFGHILCEIGQVDLVFRWGTFDELAVEY